MSSRTVRRIQGFYEVESGFAVPRDYAGDILKASLAVASEYVGPLALDSMKGVRIKTPANPIWVKGLRIDGGPHTALLTRRQFEGKTAAHVASGAALTSEPYSPDESKIFVSDDEDPNSTIITGVHELGHSFGLGHCIDSSCIMRPRHDPNPQFLKAPFCANCVGDLELAGFSALATQL